MGSAPDGIVPPAAASIGIAAAADEFPDQGVLGHQGRVQGLKICLLYTSGMSSRLFQEVRERRGLCYSVYTYGAGHAETGVFAIYTALGKETEAQALETICRTIRDFAERGPAAEELDRARELSKEMCIRDRDRCPARCPRRAHGCRRRWGRRDR